MRVHVVSDVHGAFDALPAAAEHADLFICLGDILLYLDYDDPTQGAFAEVFGPQVTAEYIELRRRKEFAAARNLTAQAWEQLGGSSDPAARMQRFGPIIDRQYREFFEVMPSGSVMTFGNVDVPALAAAHIPATVDVIDGAVVERGGVRFGLVGAGLRSVYRTPNEIDEDQYAQKIADLGPVDVLCTHIPPAIPALTFDVVARRFEVGSQAIRSLIERTQPRYALFGHVHQPLARRFRIGRTECLNVGHFRNRRRPLVLNL